MKDIDFVGKRTGEGIELRSDTHVIVPETGKAEHFTLSAVGDGFIGEWSIGASAPLKVALTLLDPERLEQPFGRLGTVQHWKLENPYEYARIAQFRLEEHKSEQIGTRTIQWISFTGIPVRSFRVVKGYPRPVMDSINDRLLEVLIENSQAHLDCTRYPNGEFDVTVKKPFFSDAILSVARSFSYYCGGAYPDYGVDAINVDGQTGKSLNLDEVLFFPDSVTEKSDPDARDVSRSRGLRLLLKRLYPQQFSTSEDGCDYDEDNVWSYVSWYATTKGLRIEPSFPHVVGVCRLEEWSTIPYSVVKRYKNPKSGVSLP
jgi:hypothetical protein